MDDLDLPLSAPVEAKPAPVKVQTTFNHSCIKCQTKYQSKDPDPYYCTPCNEERKALAATIDAKMAGRSKTPPLTPLQEYDQAQKVRGLMFIKL